MSRDEIVYVVTALSAQLAVPPRGRPGRQVRDLHPARPGAHLPTCRPDCPNRSSHQPCSALVIRKCPRGKCAHKPMRAHWWVRDRELALAGQADGWIRPITIGCRDAGSDRRNRLLPSHAPAGRASRSARLGGALALLSVDGMIVAASKTARFPPAGTSGPGTAVTSGGADGQAIRLGRGAGHV